MLNLQKFLNMYLTDCADTYFFYAINSSKSQNELCCCPMIHYELGLERY